MYKHVRRILGNCPQLLICSCMALKVWQCITIPHHPLKCVEGGIRYWHKQLLEGARPGWYTDLSRMCAQQGVKTCHYLLPSPGTRHSRRTRPSHHYSFLPCLHIQHRYLNMTFVHVYFTGSNLIFCYIIQMIFYALNQIMNTLCLKNAVFWNVTLCGSCKNRRFGGTERLHDQADRNRWNRNVSRN
jgi:hypothetical protein